MNIRKIGEWNRTEGTIEIKPMWITKQWRRITGYRTRGYKNRVHLVGRSKMIIDNPKLVIRIKRNRVFGLVYKSYKK
jgi:hypothetical protein